MTSATMPWTIWFDAVLDAVGNVPHGHEQVAPFRERMAAAYNAGEPVWMAADELRFRLRAAERASRLNAGAKS